MQCSRHSVDPTHAPHDDTVDLRQVLEQVDEVNKAVVDDITTMRQDINKLQQEVQMLKRGGWEVNVGPFQHIEKTSIKEDNQIFCHDGAGGTAPPSSNHASPSGTGPKAKAFVPPHLRKRAAGQAAGIATPAQPTATKQAESKTATHESIPNQAESTPFIREPNSKLAEQVVPAPGCVEKTSSLPPEHLAQHVDKVQPTLKRVDSFMSEHSNNIVTATESTLDPDQPIQSVEIELASDTFIETPHWRPHYIKSLPPLPADLLTGIPPPSALKTFSFAFLKEYLGGIEWSPGFFYTPKAHGGCILPNRTYYALSAQHEPFIPSHPGTHGAKLTAFFNVNPDDASDDGEAIYDYFPLFISASQVAPNSTADRYVYFGTYTQARWSDRVGYDDMKNHIPQSVLEHWAKQLSSVGRPEWVTDALRKHFFPTPEYIGSLGQRAPATGSEVHADEGESGPNDVDVEAEAAAEAEAEKQFKADVESYISDLRAWKHDADIKTNCLSFESLVRAFERADSDDPPGLRLQWEYLKCIGYEPDFYNLLVMRQAQREVLH